jgi:hypothetical protein
LSIGCIAYEDYKLHGYIQDLQDSVFVIYEDIVDFHPQPFYPGEK